MRLFIVSSPFLMYVAQSIIEQEQKKDNLLVYWHVEGKKNHIKSYKIQKISKFWRDEIYLKDWLSNYEVSFKSLTSIINLYFKLEEKEKEIRSLLLKYRIKELVIGNRYNPIDRHFYFVAKKMGIRISIMEDGMRNYIDESEIVDVKNIKIGIKKAILGNKYKIFNIFDEIKYDSKYCLLSIEKNEKNKKINLGKEMSKELKIYFQNKIIKSDGLKHTLFLSQSLSEDNEIRQEDEIEIIIKKLLKLKKEKIYFKFHPRDSEEKKEKILNELKKNDISFENVTLDIDRKSVV